MTTYPMSAKELDRVEVVRRLLRQEIRQVQAAALLGLSPRQVRRLTPRFQERGPRGLVHASRGRAGNHRMPDAERVKIVRLLHARYPDFGPTFAAEKLSERHGIARDPKTIRQLMLTEGLWIPRRGKARSEHRQWRQRKAALGELVQFDGSYHDWFEGRGGLGEICLLAAIDDATGEVLHAKFVADEGVFPVFGFWRGYVERLGVPRAVYLDRFSTYKMTQRVAVENPDLKTQFQRAMAELRCEVIFARSPQAKGRVERLFGTLQDRLIKELRLEGIATTEAANRFLADVFLPKFNARFAVAPASPANLHRVLTAREHPALDAIFSRQETRVVRNDWTVSYASTWYQLLRQQPVTVCRQDVVTVEERPDGTVRFRLRGKVLNAAVLPARPTKVKDLPWVLAKTAVAVPVPAA